LEVETEDLGYASEVRVNRHQIPLGIVFDKVHVCDCDLDPPMLFITLLHMPVNANGAHVM